MNQNKLFNFSLSVWAVPFGVVLLMWLIFWFEIRFGIRFNSYGIYPRQLSGVVGIFFSPFIHGSADHLLHNSLPLAVLLALQLYFYPRRVYRLIVKGIFWTGIITWIMGRPSYHIGASGLIYFLAGFIFFKGVFSRHYRHVALSLMVVFLYGSMIWYVLPIRDGLSWEGHLAGLITGLIFARITHDPAVSSPEYVWEQPDYNEESDPFMLQFDQFGNFIDEVSKNPEKSQIAENELVSEENPAKNL